MDASITSTGTPVKTWHLPNTALRVLRVLCALRDSDKKPESRSAQKGLSCVDMHTKKFIKAEFLLKTSGVLRVIYLSACLIGKIALLY